MKTLIIGEIFCVNSKVRILRVDSVHQSEDEKELKRLAMHHSFNTKIGDSTSVMLDEDLKIMDMVFDWEIEWSCEIPEILTK